MSELVGPTEITPGLPTSPAGGEGWTVDLLEGLPDDGLRYEMMDGLLIVHPPAGEEWTVDLLERLPDNGLQCEIIDGLLIVSPPPEPRQRLASGRLHRILEANCPDDSAVVVAPLVWQPDRRTSLQPDLLVVAKDRRGEKTITETPVLVVEVLSPSSSRYDRTMKLSRYAEAVIPQYWIVDPLSVNQVRPSIEVYDLDDTGIYRLIARSEDDREISVTGPIPVTVAASALV